MNGGRGGRTSRTKAPHPETAHAGTTRFAIPGGKAMGREAAADDAWTRYTGTVRPLRGRPPVAPEPPPPPKSPPPKSGPPKSPPPKSGPPTFGPAEPQAAPAGHAQALAIGAAPAGLDRANWGRLRSGRTVAARTLDLHGRTAAAAHRALGRFLAQAAADGVRCVEIVTGRGAGPEGGVLRRELPHWLNAPALRPLILGAVHPHPANPGAVRVLLRRDRSR